MDIYGLRFSSSLKPRRDVNDSIIARHRQIFEGGEKNMRSKRMKRQQIISICHCQAVRHTVYLIPGPDIFDWIPMREITSAHATDL